MSAATFSDFPNGCCGFQLRDLHARFAGNVDQMLPGKSFRPLCGELVAKWHGIMIVEQDEVVANGQLEPSLNNEAVLHGARNGAHIHDFVGADEGFS